MSGVILMISNFVVYAQNTIGRKEMKIITL